MPHWPASAVPPAHASWVTGLAATICPLSGATADVLFREPGQRHLQTVEPDARCISLVVNAGSFVPLTWTGRLLRLIARP
jgi:hypothetical protein